jgi:hypothetical protein
VIGGPRCTNSPELTLLVRLDHVFIGRCCLYVLHRKKNIRRTHISKSSLQPLHAPFNSSQIGSKEWSMAGMSPDQNIIMAAAP